MKSRIKTLLALMTSMALLAPISLALTPTTKAEAAGCVSASLKSGPIDLKDNTAEEIREYYSSLSSLSESELKGENLLKNLKPILYNMSYYSYDAVWKIYEITDRDWTLSPASDDAYGSYSPATNRYQSYQYSTNNTNTKNNPYIHALYRNPDGGTDSLVRALGDHDATGINREHVWCQSRGFKAPSGANGPAGTDVHHLIAADGYVNQSIHNNSPYGNVDTSRAHTDAKDNKNYLSGNLLGYSSTFGSSTTKVFEPQDCDKGDIARACFYMAARYNNIAGETGVISQYEPNLTLANEVTSDGAAEDSSDTHAVSMGILQDLLEWHKLDPVDEYEIHRNNLIYNNYQYNRNPFIDFPEWVDYIWGTVDGGTYSNTPTGKADPSNDVINGYKESDSITLTISKTSETIKVDGTTSLSATTSGTNITWTVSDSSIAQLDKSSTTSGETITVTALKAGTVTITATVADGENSQTRTCTLTVNPKDSGGGGSEEPTPVEPANEEPTDIVQLIKDNIVIVAIAAGILVVLIIIIIVVASKNKKAAKVMKKVAKKAVKKVVKKK